MSVERKAMVRDIVGKLPPPDALEVDEEKELPESEGEESEDAEADMAAQRTAMSDFLTAIGVKPKRLDEALTAFKDLMEHCGSYDE